MPPHTVFISYSTHDRVVAEELCAGLEAAGLRCWIAPRDIQPGLDWSVSISTAIGSSKTMLLLLSGSSNSSRQIAHEAHLANDGGTLIVPVRIEDVVPQGALQYLLSGTQWIDSLTPPHHDAVDTLVGLLSSEIDGVETRTEPRIEPRPMPSVRPRHNLPEQLSPFIGREAEVAEIGALLEQSRLVSLIGAGGIGKTRVALRVAADVRSGDADVGAWFVDLASIEDPTLVPSTIAEVFDIADEGGSKPLIERIVSALKAKRLLIVLDNCEQVISAAADATDRLLRGCSGIRVLATSREPLGIDGEEQYRLPSLPVPPEGAITAERVMQYAAAALFVSKAHAARRDFALTDENAGVVADIVRRLDGIALAIELAAARVKVLSVAQLDKRLDERFKLLTGGSRTAPSRQKTLHALIGWSYDLLTPAEQSMLRQCAVFRGGWTLEAAEAICSDDRFADWNSLDLLTSLVDKSLVVVETGGEEQRYRLLESTRQFALQRLAEAGEREAVAARHCAYHCELAQGWDAALWQTDSDAWLAAARRELENARAAIEWGLGGEGNAEAAATIVASLHPFWWTSARREGRQLLARTTTLLSEDAPARVRGLLALARAVLDAGSAQAAVPAAEAVRLLGGIDERARADALQHQGYALGNAGHLAETVGVYEEALRAARATGAARLIACVLTFAAYWLGALGDRARAHACADEAAVLLQACGDRRRLAQLQMIRAELRSAAGDLAGALADVTEAAAAYRERNAESQLAGTLLNAAAYLLALRRWDEAWFSAREALGLAVSAEGATYVAIAIGHLAQLAAETGDAERAARLLAYGDAYYRKDGSVRERTEARGYDRALELIRAVLPEDRIAALAAEGAGMERDAAVAEALAIPRPPVS